MSYRYQNIDIQINNIIDNIYILIISQMGCKLRERNADKYAQISLAIFDLTFNEDRNKSYNQFSKKFSIFIQNYILSNLIFNLYLNEVPHSIKLIKSYKRISTFQILKYCNT